MLDVLKRDSKASFFFVGAEDENDELGMATRQFRVYKKFTTSWYLKDYSSIMQ